MVVGYGPGEFLRWLHRRRGPVVSLGFGSSRYVYLLGAEANRFVFANDELFRMREAFAALVPVDGETSLIVSDGPDHRRRRRLVQPAMHHRQVDQYVRVMVDTADETIDRWRPGQVVDAYQEFRGAIRRSTMRALFGDRLARDADFLGRHLQALLDLVDRSPQLIGAHRALRSPLWRRAMRARQVVDGWVHEEIARVRTLGADSDDQVLALLVRGRDGDGGGLTDEEVRDQAITLIAAGYETTSGAMAWAVHALLTHPEVERRAVAELRSVLDGAPPGAEDLARLPYLRAVVSESLRLYPPAVVSVRYVAQDFEFAGVRVGAGSMLLYSPYVTHRSAAVYERPLEFRPQRWLPGSPEYRKVGPHEFAPFGGGPHRCVGSTMATTELTVMLARLLGRVQLDLVSRSVRPTGLAAMRPRRGLRVRVRSMT
ncbi:cytochrome P450 [Actinophytocola xanthii]|uniref:Cytochrome P450 n=1 Tax=Actinophytocola xanthii TaxID=1912961 RepID=A0A1Q8CWN9_9PSEU|nr:cytochrome P450 [Actinophytocola xanthii]OLF18756.1 cytochrome P450 [Actinophytocola xanthii]